MTREATFYIQGVIWDPPIEDHLRSVIDKPVHNGAGIIMAIDGIQSRKDARESLEEIDDDLWNWSSWFYHAVSSGSPTIGVRDPDTAKIVGFCSMARDAFVAGSPFTGLVDLNLEITAVYIRPDYRGRGYATSLREAAAAYLRSIIDTIAAIPSEDIKDLALQGLSVAVSSYPESQEGLAFANRLSGEVETHLAAIADKAWFGQAVFIDETDPEEAPSPI